MNRNSIILISKGLFDIQQSSRDLYNHIEEKTENIADYCKTCSRESYHNIDNCTKRNIQKK